MTRTTATAVKVSSDSTTTMRATKFLLVVAFVATGAIVAACNPTAPAPLSFPATTPSPSPPATPPLTTPNTSSLIYDIPAAPTHGAGSGNYTTANASFRGSVRTTCVPNPNIAGSVCPDLMVLVQPVSAPFCLLWAFAPVGETLTVGSYPNAQRLASAGIAGLSFNCAQGGTTCNWSVGQFTLYELQADPSGTVTRLHMTFEQTCVPSPTMLNPGGSGKLTSELWIIDGRTPF